MTSEAPSDRFPSVALGHLIAVHHGYAFAGDRFNDRGEGNLLVTPGNFKIGGGFTWGKRKFYDGPVGDRYIFSPGDLAITMTDLSKASDTLGSPAIMPANLEGRRLLHNQRIGRVEILRPDLVDPAYLYCALRTDRYRRQIVAGATGTTVKHTSPKRIYAAQIPLPSLAEQKQIADVFSALDDKIDSNGRVAALLEEAAATLFKARFVDCVGAKDFEESAIGQIPKGWSVGSIYDVASITYGRPFKSGLFSSENGMPLVRIRDLPSAEPSVRTPEVRGDARLVRTGDLVVSMDREFRVYAWSGSDAWLNQRVCAFDPKDNVSRVYLMESIKPALQFFEATKSGTTVIHLGKRDIDTFQVLVPPADVMDHFRKEADPLLIYALGLREECRKLAEIRDELLPKLVSGEITVPVSTVERVGIEADAVSA